MTAKPWRPKTLERLDALIQNARSDKEKRILLVKKACALARFSFVEEAAAILKSVKSSASAYEPRLNAWLTLCEGLIGHFSRLAEDAIRDFRRAYAVSIASGDMELTAIASAWKLHREMSSAILSSASSALSHSNCNRPGKIVISTAPAPSWPRRERYDPCRCP